MNTEGKEMETQRLEKKFLKCEFLGVQSIPSQLWDSGYCFIAFNFSLCFNTGRGIVSPGGKLRSELLFLTLLKF